MLVNDAAFALSFFICRLLLGPFVVWATVASRTTPWIVKVRATHCGCVLGGFRWVEVLAGACLIQLHGAALVKAPTSAPCSVQVPVGTGKHCPLPGLPLCSRLKCAVTSASRWAHMHLLASRQAVLLAGLYLFFAALAQGLTAFPGPLLQLGGVGIFVVSLFWASKILRMIQRTVLGGSKKQKT